MEVIPDIRAVLLVILFHRCVKFDLAAAVAYGVVDGDIRKVIYWVSAAVLSITVTF